nr:hypothetical protein [Tanacetum cinerariifolium]
MSNDKESSAASTDNHASMLEENDYESWKIRMKKYIRSKPQGKATWKSIVKGPTPHPMTAAVTGVANVVVEAPRPKRDEEFTAEENARDLADIQASSILSQGVPQHIFNTLNQTDSAKEMWENIELLMKGSGLSEQFALPTSTSSSTLALEQQAQSGSDAMMATMQQLVNLLSGFQKQFPPMNNQLRTSSNPRSTKGNQDYGKKTDRNGKKVICYNCRGEGHVAREYKEPKRAKDTQYYKYKMMLSDAKDSGVILDAEAEAFLADVECTESYDESLALTTTTAFQVSHEDAYDFDIDDGPQLLSWKTCHPLRKQTLEGYIKTNKDLSRANESLKAKLAQCKLEMQILERNKVKHDLDQAIVDRKKRNTELEQENSLLKTTLFNKEESIKALNEKILRLSLKRRTLMKGILKR